MENNKTIKQTIKDAEKGNAEAQCEFDRCYLKGDGVEKNETEAFKWIRNAAEQKLADAQFLLGVCY